MMALELRMMIRARMMMRMDMATRRRRVVFVMVVVPLVRRTSLRLLLVQVCRNWRGAVADVTGGQIGIGFAQKSVERSRIEAVGDGIELLRGRDRAEPAGRGVVGALVEKVSRNR